MQHGLAVSKPPAIDTAARILDAAEHCMGRHGLRVSMNDVAVQAGLSRRTVYHHYPNRDALVGAVLERTVAAFVAAVAPHVDRQPTLADQVAEAAVQITQHRADVARPAGGLTVLRLGAAPADPAVGAAVAEPAVALAVARLLARGWGGAFAGEGLKGARLANEALACARLAGARLAGASGDTRLAEHVGVHFTPT